MPEAIRATALGYKLSGDHKPHKPLAKGRRGLLSAITGNLNRGFAYQARTMEGPVDYVPATPDLDPGYHTGLSLLAAIRAIQD